jgi:hypothetical protein
MKPFTYLNDDLSNKINMINIELNGRESNSNINYMEIKEYSEKMARARTQAQYEILRFKYQSLGETKEPEKLRQAIHDYKIMKATYFGLYHAYLEQCQKKTANDHRIQRRHRKVA